MHLEGLSVPHSRVNSPSSPLLVTSHDCYSWSPSPLGQVLSQGALAPAGLPHLFGAGMLLYSVISTLTASREDVGPEMNIQGQEVK